jgi:hypothetical protein
VSPELNLRKAAQDIVSCTMPECQTKAANTARMLSATEGLIASRTIVASPGVAVFANFFSVTLGARAEAAATGSALSADLGHVPDDGKVAASPALAVAGRASSETAPATKPGQRSRGGAEASCRRTSPVALMEEDEEAAEMWNICES